MDQLFSTKADFSIVRLSEYDVRGLSDHFMDLRELILRNEQMYPGIDRWLDEKVIPGLSNSERIGYIGYLDEVPAVSAVVKRGESSKFCHLKIREDLQDKHLGEAFFCLMALEARNAAKEVHFTLPESLWVNEKKFFVSFGFDNAIKAGHQYRLFEDELRCSSPFETVWKTVVEKLPKIARAFSINGGSCEARMLMSVKPENATRILSGRKRVEIRRRFSKKWSGCRISIYASKPRCSVVGDALVSEVILDNRQRIWERFGERIGCTREQFDDYARTAEVLYAIILDDVIPYERELSLSEASQAVNETLRPPQGYRSLETSKGWAEAVSIGAFIERSFGSGHKIFV